MAKATPQTGAGPKTRGVPGQQPATIERTIERTIEPGRRVTAAERAVLQPDAVDGGGTGPGGETGEARARQAAQSTALGSARVPEIPDDIGERSKPNTPATSTVPREIEPKGRGATMARPSIPPVGPAMIVKDLRKIPRLVGEAGKGMRDAPIEASSEDAAIDMANAKGRAVLSPGGWVCPTIVKERA
jgi:hypothetical protein